MYASLPKHALEPSRITDRVPTGSRVERAYGPQLFALSVSFRNFPDFGT